MHWDFVELCGYNVTKCSMYSKGCKWKVELYHHVVGSIVYNPSFISLTQPKAFKTNKSLWLAHPNLSIPTRSVGHIQSNSQQ